ncbi:MAG: tRNA-dihydrouridine synthase [bacterium]|nr:tRNA-dihydrouridine synthase [bacterium]
MNKDFWKKLNKPIIGLAPMDGYTDSAYRRICKLVNPDIIVYTEFTSADGLHHKAKKLKQKLKFFNDEKPVIAQIFGKNPDTYITAARLCEDMGFSGIDLNMGCPAKKIVKSEHGIALRKKPDLAFKLIESVAKNTKLPVSVKTRLGLNNADSLHHFALGAQNAGANMICIHARTYKEPYKVPASWEPLYELKNHLTIPLIGNGGVQDIEDGLKKMNNLNGFLIGQASIGNPWVFNQTGTSPDLKEKIKIIKMHARWLVEAKGEYTGTREIRKYLISYFKGLQRAKDYRKKFISVESLKDIESILDKLALNYKL